MTYIQKDNRDHKKKIVAIFTSDILPISETFIRDQALSLKDWEPVLIGRKKIPQSLCVGKIRTVIIPQTKNIFFKILRQWLSLPDPNLRRALRDLNIDLVHAHFGINAVEIWPSIKSAKIPLITTLHGFDINIQKEWWQQGYGGKINKTYPRKLIELSQKTQVKFIAVSDSIKNRAIDYGICANRISTAYIGIDNKKFTAKGNSIELRKNRILFVGRMVEKKAPLLLINAFHELKKTITDAELVMIGDGPLLSTAKELAYKLNVPITFCGAVQSSEIPAHLELSKIFCLPSITASNGDAEGLPIAILEAMAAGVPVVTSAKGAVGEAIIDGVNGFCILENNVDQLTTRLIDLLSNSSLLTNFSKKAMATISEKFCLDENTKELELIYSNHFKSI